MGIGLEDRLMMAGFGCGFPDAPRTTESSYDYARRVRPFVDCFDEGGRVEVMRKLMEISEDHRSGWHWFCESTRHSPRRFFNEDVSDWGVLASMTYKRLVGEYEKRVMNLVSRHRAGEPVNHASAPCVR